MKCRYEQTFDKFLERIHKVHFVERETSKRIFVVPGEIDKSSNDCQTRIMYGQKFGRKLVKPLRIEKNRNGQKKNPKLDSSRRLRRTYFIDADDTKSTKKLSRMRGERFMAPTMPCKRQPSIMKVVAKPEIASGKIQKTMYSCIVESNEPTRQRAESSQSKKHEDKYRALPANCL